MQWSYHSSNLKVIDRNSDEDPRDAVYRRTHAARGHPCAVTLYGAAIPTAAATPCPCTLLRTFLNDKNTLFSRFNMPLQCALLEQQASTPTFGEHGTLQELGYRHRDITWELDSDDTLTVRNQVSHLSQLVFRHIERVFTCTWGDIYALSVDGQLRLVHGTRTAPILPQRVCAGDGVVTQFAPSVEGCAALMADGTVEHWVSTHARDTYDTAETQALVRGMRDIVAVVAQSNTSFAALDAHGNVTCWGNSFSAFPYATLQGVSALAASDRTFVARMRGASDVVVCWGTSAHYDARPADARRALVAAEFERAASLV